MRRNTGPVLRAAIALAFAAAAYAQAQEAQPRSLWDSEFRRNRPAVKKVSPTPKAPPTSGAGNSPLKTNDPAGVADDAFLGLTVWQLRPSRAGDEPRVRMFVHKDGNGVSWTPERVAADAPLSNDPQYRYRFSFETSRAGYLYIVDREQFTDHSFGRPKLIFPTRKIRGGDNWVTPGFLVEIPGRDDDPPYLNLDAAKGQVAEVLTLLVTSQPLAEVKAGSEPIELDPGQLAEWEHKWSSPVASLEAPTVGQAWTLAEKEAGTGAILLTSHDPTPQTLYKMRAKAGQPLLVTVPFRIQASAR